MDRDRYHSEISRTEYLEPLVNLMIVVALGIASLGAGSELLRVNHGEFGKTSDQHGVDWQQKLPGHTEDALWIGMAASGTVLAVGSGLARRELKKS